MMFYEFEVGAKTYKLRLNTRALVELEKRIGCNPLSIFNEEDKLPTISVMVAILHASLQQYQHNITINDAYDIFDEYLASGKTMPDFVWVILEIYKNSGLISTEVNTEKN